MSLSTSITGTEFLHNLAESRLLDHSLIDDIHDGFTHTDGHSLADKLVQRGLLTRYQAKRLRQGRTDFFLDRYKLLSPLMAGSMGRVYLAEHVSMRRKVVLKVTLRTDVAVPYQLERFRREAQVLAAMNHPNVVQAFDFEIEGKRPYLVMEYVEALDSRTIVKRFGAIHWSHAADYIRQTAMALSHIHQAGFVHHDIKPQNLLVDQTGHVKVIDFGLVGRIGKTERCTETGKEMRQGSWDYAAPEQSRKGYRADPRADIYALGTTFYYLVTMRRLFPGLESIDDIIVAHRKQPPPSITRFCPRIPQSLTDIIYHMLAKNPADRPQTPDDVVEALEQFAITHDPVHPVSHVPKAETLCISTPGTNNPLVSRSSSSTSRSSGDARDEVPDGSTIKGFGNTRQERVAGDLGIGGFYTYAMIAAGLVMSAMLFALWVYTISSPSPPIVEVKETTDSNVAHAQVPLLAKISEPVSAIQESDEPKISISKSSIGPLIEDRSMANLIDETQNAHNWPPDPAFPASTWIGRSRSGNEASFASIPRAFDTLTPISNRSRIRESLVFRSSAELSQVQLRQHSPIYHVTRNQSPPPVPESRIGAALVPSTSEPFVNSIGLPMLPIGDGTATTFISSHLVTVAQFRRFVKATGYRTVAEESNAGGYVWTAPKPEQATDGMTVYIGKVATTGENAITLQFGPGQPKQEFAVIDEAKVTLDSQGANLTQLASDERLYARIACRTAGRLKFAYTVNAGHLRTIHQDSFKQHANANWRRPLGDLESRDSEPAVQITWRDAVEFCRWLGTLEGNAYRLPTTAESETGASLHFFQWCGADRQQMIMYQGLDQSENVLSKPVATPNHLLGFRVVLGAKSDK